mmetsp:Transcript_11309/g.27615  ORF Transcript_11309/g.27615 Transcript_11309/m.27615 type:complete len:200 (-) Transcript_11309:951-1550(-)
MTPPPYVLPSKVVERLTFSPPHATRHPKKDRSPLLRPGPISATMYSNKPHLTAPSPASAHAAVALPSAAQRPTPNATLLCRPPAPGLVLSPSHSSCPHEPSHLSADCTRKRNTHGTYGIHPHGTGACTHTNFNEVKHTWPPSPHHPLSLIVRPGPWVGVVGERAAYRRAERKSGARRFLRIHLLAHADECGGAQRRRPW